MWWWLLLATSVLLVATVLGLRTRKQRRQRQQLMQVHESRSRTVHGCVECGCRLDPPNLMWVCGKCPDTFSMCDGCYRQRRAVLAHEQECGHGRFFLERVYWEVDVSRLESPDAPLPVLLGRAMKLYGERWFLGRIVGAADEPALDWLTYRDVREQALRVAYALTQANGEEKQPPRFVYTTVASSVAFFVAQYGSLLAGVPVVHMHPTVRAAALADCFRKAPPLLVLVSVHQLAPLAEALRGVATVLAVSDSVDLYPGVPVCDVSATSPLIVAGQWQHWIDAVPLRRAELAAFWRGHKRRLQQRGSSSSSIAMLIPTSGSTGTPKLSVLSCDDAKRHLQPPKFGAPCVMLSHELLRQSLDIVSKGGRIACFSGVEHLRRDLQLVRPTVFGATPAFWQSLHKEFEVFFSSQSSSSTALSFQDAVKHWQHRVQPLGNRCRLLIVGGAKSSESLRHFMFTVLGGAVIDGYGSTEVGGLTSSGEVRRGVELLLVDCPDLGYTTLDVPHPRGEILAHSPKMSAGYYGDEQQTRDAFVVVNGKRYFRTGDVGEQHADGRILVIDRVSALFKLAQGHYVAPAPLEQALAASPLVAKLFIFGDASMRSVAAAVLPSSADVSEQQLLQAFRQLAAEHGLRPFEVPRSVIVERDVADWTPDNGLYTTVGKPNRRELSRRYMPVYQRQRREQEEEVKEDDERIGGQQPAVQTSNCPFGFSLGLRRILIETLGVAPAAFDALDFDAVSPASLGSDSMQLAVLVNRLRDAFGVAIPLAQLVRVGSLWELQRRAFGNEPGASDNVNDASFFAAELSAAVDALAPVAERAAAAATSSAPRHDALLTGATGFFGAFLLRALLQQQSEGCVHCLVRARDAAEAWRRLDDNLAAYGVALTAEQRARCRVICGDLDSVGSAVDSATGGALRRVYHNAAVVNSALPYARLRAANVTGTQNVVELCLRYGLELVHVSTIGVCGGSGVREEQPVPLHGGLGALSGYASSKWVAESLVLEAARRWPRLAAVVVRPGTISGDSASGAANVKDGVLNLLLGVAQLGVCYPIDATDGPLPRLLCMAPVDWTAQAVVHIAALLPHCPHAVYNLVNRWPLSLGEACRAIELFRGAPMQTVTTPQFRAAVERITEPSHPLFINKLVLAAGKYESASADTLPSSQHTDAAFTPSPPVTAEHVAAQLAFADQQRRAK